MGNRLISADALKESVRKKFKALSDRCEINGLVNAAPTIDAIPVEWLESVLNEAKEYPMVDRELIVAIPYLIKRWQKEQEAR